MFHDPLTHMPLPDKPTLHRFLEKVFRIALKHIERSICDQYLSRIYCYD